MNYNIVTDLDKLRIPCSAIDVEQGILLGKELISIIKKNSEVIGLSANQIGIQKCVSVILTNHGYMTLVNPKIISSYGNVLFIESCISLPKKEIKTYRPYYITVKSDNYEGVLSFGVEKGFNGITDDNFKDIRECVCVQHEIDHLNGITMIDTPYRLQPRNVDFKIGRNDKIIIKNPETEEVKTIKNKYYTDNYSTWEILPIEVTE